MPRQIEPEHVRVILTAILEAYDDNESIHIAAVQAIHDLGFGQDEELFYFKWLRDQGAVETGKELRGDDKLQGIPLRRPLPRAREMLQALNAPLEEGKPKIGF